MIWKYLVLFFITIHFSFLQFAKALQIDIEVWKAIYQDIKQQNTYYHLRSKFESVIMLVDPINGKFAFDYDKSMDSETKKLFESYAFQDQVAIMEARYFPVDTLSTILIVDTTQTFQETIYQLDSSIQLLIQYNIPAISATNYWKVFAIDDKSENIIVCFLNINVSNVYYCYYLSNYEGRWKVTKRRADAINMRSYE